MRPCCWGADVLGVVQDAILMSLWILSTSVEPKRIRLQDNGSVMPRCWRKRLCLWTVVQTVSDCYNRMLSAHDTPGALPAASASGPVLQVVALLLYLLGVWDVLPLVPSRLGALAPISCSFVSKHE